MKLEELKKEITWYIKNIDFILNTKTLISDLEDIQNSIASDNRLMSLYNNRNVNQLISLYQLKIDELKKVLYSEDFEQYLLNILEYMRFMCMTNDFVGIKNIIFYENLSDSVLSASLLGKGTDNAQARFLISLLPDSKNYFVTIIRKTSYDNPYHTLENNSGLLMGKKFVCPSSYTGITDEDDSVYVYTERVEKIKFDETKRKSARKLASDYLIRLLNIDNILNINDTMSNDEIIDSIIEYIKNNYTKYTALVKHYSIVINGYALEITKALELFLTYYGISYEIISSDTKENTKYKVNDKIIDLKSIIDISLDKQKQKVIVE